MSKTQLPLKTVQPYEILVCAISGQHMFGGDWYYEDTNGKTYLYEAYHQRKQAIKRNQFDFSKLLEAQSQTEYKQMLKHYQQQVIEADLDARFEQENMNLKE